LGEGILRLERRSRFFMADSRQEMGQVKMSSHKMKRGRSKGEGEAWKHQIQQAEWAQKRVLGARESEGKTQPVTHRTKNKESQRETRQPWRPRSEGGSCKTCRRGKGQDFLRGATQQKARQKALERDAATNEAWKAREGVPTHTEARG